MGIPPRSRGTVLARARTSFAARHFILPVQKFVHTETVSGIVLLTAAAVALIWANSPWSAAYEKVWNSEAALHLGRFVVAHSLREWINDALMAIFFLVVGLEVKREFMHGELSGWRRASLPVFSALGGMLVPALLYMLLNSGTPASRGWGIPMATDIAFALGVLALAGSGVPVALRIFLLALATVDDIGAILVIAVFYSERLSLVPLGLAVLLLVLMVAMLRLGIQNLIYYLPVAVFFWFAVLQSGIHATIAGVAMGLIAPTSAYIKKETFVKYLEPLLQDAKLALAGRQEATAEAIFGEVAELSVATESIADRLVRVLHPWSSYLVLPLFAFANTGLFLSWDLARQAWGSPITRGVVAGLVLGKVAGIVVFAWIAVRLGAARLLSGVRWAQMASVGLLGGIGFTVSLFISELAFGYPSQVAEAKVGILLASVLSGIAGYGILRLTASGSGSSAVAGGEDMKNTVPRRETDVVLSTT